MIALAIDAVADDRRVDSEIRRQFLPPHGADDQMTIGGDDRTSLHRGDDGIVEDVDMVHGANEAGDQAALFQGCERVGGYPVLRMKYIEPPMRRVGEMVDVF